MAHLVDIVTPTLNVGTKWRCGQLHSK